LADPDWPRKVRDGREDTLIRCQYGNVCKALDENFERVVCTLWPKGALQAPCSDDRIPPRWPAGGARLEAVLDRGRVKLLWERAIDNEEVYAYEVERAVGAGPFSHLMTVRGRTPGFRDEDVLGGFSYRYRVRAYDVAGNRGERSEETAIRLPLPWSQAT
jgi:hypothetical protein